MNEEVQKTGFKKWLPLAVLSLGLTIIILDSTILNVSLRTIINDLHTNIQSIQWVITGYSLIIAAFTVTGGRLGDLFGRKKMFMLGAVVFAVGSFIASISHSVGFLLAGEAVIEGFGAALMTPATMSLIAANYKGRDRQIGFGVWGAIAGGAIALGPVVGGWLTTYASWRWAFRINVGVAALLILGSMLISESRDTEEKTSLDIGGVVLSSLGLLSIVFGFIKASDYGWLFMKESASYFGITFSQGGLSIVPIAVVVGLFILGLFGLWENRVKAQGKTPLVSLSLFKNSQFTLAVAITALLSLGLSGLSFAIPIFLQAVRHLSALDTGFAMLPMSLALFIAAPLSAVVSKYIAPKRLVQLGLVLGGLGFFVLRSGVAVDAGVFSLVPGFILFGAGMGLMMSQLGNMAISAVSLQEAGEVSGVNSTFRTVGQTLGSAVLGAVIISSFTNNLVSGVNASTIIPEPAKPAIVETVKSQASSIEFGTSDSKVNSEIPSSIKTEISSISASSTVTAAREAFLIGVGFFVLALLLSVKLPAGKDIEVEKPITEVTRVS